MHGKASARSPEPPRCAWLGELDGFAGGFVHMDWHELSILAGEEEIDDAIRAGIRAFDSDEPDDWRPLFSWCNIGFDPVTGAASIGSKGATGPALEAYCLSGERFERVGADSEPRPGTTENTLSKRPWWRPWG